MVSGLRMKVDELDVAMWIRMTWRDPRLEICACAKNGSSIEHEQYDETNTSAVQVRLERWVWTPELSLKDQIHPVRREGEMLDFQVQADRSGGVKVSFTANLRVSVKCKYKTRGFPYDKNNCSVTIVNLNEEHVEAT